MSHNNKNNNKKFEVTIKIDEDETLVNSNCFKRQRRLIIEQQPDEDKISKEDEKEEEEIKMIESSTESHQKTDNDIIYKHDVVTVIFTYLNCREMGVASMACTDWNSIFNSDGVQTKPIKDDIRWAKYAYDGGNTLEPKKISEGSNHYELCHVLDDGRWVATRSEHVEDDDIFNYYMDAYSIQGELIETIEIHESATHIVSNDRLLYLAYGHQRLIHLWLMTDGTDDSAAFTNPPHEFEDPSDNLAFNDEISFIAVLSTPNLVVYTIGNSTKVLNVLKTEEEERFNIFYSWPCHDIVCRDKYLVTRSNDEIKIWNFQGNDDELVREFTISHIVSITVEKINKIYRILTCHDDGSIRIYSIEDGNLIYNYSGDYNGTVFARFSPINGCIFTAPQCPSYEYSNDYNIEIWKICVDNDEAKGNNDNDDVGKIYLSLKEKISHVKHYYRLTDIALLPDGQLLSCGHQEHFGYSDEDGRMNNTIMIW